MGWMVPARRLDEAQQNVLRSCAKISDTPKWIEGFAGSGKTVLLLHSAQDYLKNNPQARVCIVVFTHALIDLISTGISPEFRHEIPVMTYHQARKDKTQYDLIVVDEVQDIPSGVLDELRKKTKSLLIGGDDAQNIYEDGSREGVIQELLNPERLKLPMVYRLTRKIMDIVKTILPDSILVTATSGRMQEIQVTLAQASNKTDEFEWVLTQAKRFTESGHPSVIILPGHSAIQDFLKFAAEFEGLPDFEFEKNRYGKPDYDLVNDHFKEHCSNLYIQYIGNSYGSLEDSDSNPVIYVMTYHSSKGLDFRTVFLPSLNSNTSFWSRDADIDRRLFFVGCTRSRRDLFMSYRTALPHPYVAQMPQDKLHTIKIKSQEEEQQDEFIF